MTPPPRLVLLDGDTGSAKTEILHRLGGVGVQMLDLEGLAGIAARCLAGFQDGLSPASACSRAVSTPPWPLGWTTLNGIDVPE